MTYDEYNAFCAALPATSHVVQWGGSQVWKVGGKVFAIGGWRSEAPGVHLQGHPAFVRNFAGAAGPAAGAVSSVARPELDSALRRART